MATKTWEAHDLELGKLTILKEGSDLRLERRYLFLDDQAQVLEQIVGGRIVETIDWADVPENVKAALIEIDTWTKNKALDQEGMSG